VKETKNLPMRKFRKQILNYKLKMITTRREDFCLGLGFNIKDKGEAYELELKNVGAILRLGSGLHGRVVVSHHGLVEIPHRCVRERRRREAATDDGGKSEKCFISEKRLG
jgi:hypothetical protein